MTSKIYEIADEQSKLIDELLEMIKVMDERLDMFKELRDECLGTHKQFETTDMRIRENY